MLITSLDNERVKKYSKLKQKKYRDDTNEFIVEGEHLVMEACKKGLVVELILEKDEVLPFDYPVVYVTEEILNRISTLESVPKIMALCKKMTEESPKKRILMLDGIQDPGNLGTIIRSAVAFDIDTVVLGENTVDLYNPKVVRASQGMLFHVNIIARSLKEEILSLKSREIPIYGTKVQYGSDVRYFKNKDKECFALIMGNEGQGVRDEILSLCDQFLYIEMNEAVESLNVGVACSIMLYEMNRRDDV